MVDAYNVSLLIQTLISVKLPPTSTPLTTPMTTNLESKEVMLAKNILWRFEEESSDNGARAQQQRVNSAAIDAMKSFYRTGKKKAERREKKSFNATMFSMDETENFSLPNVIRCFIYKFFSIY